MVEKQPGKIDVDSLSPDQRAKLLKDLQEKDPGIAIETEQLAETLGTQTNIHSDKPVKAEVGTTESDFKASVTLKTESAPELGAKSKNLLNRFFSGQESFEDVNVNPDNVAEVVDEMNSETKQ